MQRRFSVLFLNLSPPRSDLYPCQTQVDPKKNSQLTQFSVSAVSAGCHQRQQQQQREHHVRHNDGPAGSHRGPDHATAAAGRGCGPTGRRQLPSGQCFGSALRKAARIRITIDADPNFRNTLSTTSIIFHLFQCCEIKCYSFIFMTTKVKYYLQHLQSGPTINFEENKFFLLSFTLKPAPVKMCPAPQHWFRIRTYSNGLSAYRTHNFGSLTQVMTTIILRWTGVPRSRWQPHHTDPRSSWWRGRWPPRWSPSTTRLLHPLTRLCKAIQDKTRPIQ